MKKYINKKSVLITSVALLLLVAVGTSLAYVFTKTDPVENKFDPSKVSCAVVEVVEKGDSSENTANVVQTGKSKTNVQIKNTGNTDAYIRAAVVVNWMNEDGTRAWATKPVQGADYSISYNLNDNGWVDGGDGYYYYTQPVARDQLTDILITGAKQLPDKGPVGTDNTQYYLSIEIVASAIQADGMGAASAKDAWAKAKTTTNAG